MWKRLLWVLLLSSPALASAAPGHAAHGQGGAATRDAQFSSHAARGDPTARYLLGVISRKGPGAAREAVEAAGSTRKNARQDARREQLGQTHADAGGDEAPPADHLRAYLGLKLAAAVGRMLQGGLLMTPSR